MQASASAPTLKSEMFNESQDELANTMSAMAPVGSTDPKTRSANINADPQMMELKHFLRSHQHEQRLREAAELETRPASSAKLSRSQMHGSEGKRALRSEGCEDMDYEMKKLSKEEAILPYVPRTSGLPASFRPSTAQAQLEKTMDERLALLRRMDRFQTRLTWRETMDHSLKRLLVDMELSRDDCLKEYQKTAGPATFNSAVNQPRRMSITSQSMEEAEKEEEERKKAQSAKTTAFCKARCEQLDKIYHWYNVHGMKEVRKERKAPPYIRYNPSGPVMPGSMRVAPQNSRRGSVKEGGGVGHSSSSPALLAGGSAAVDGRAASPP